MNWYEAFIFYIKYTVRTKYDVLNIVKYIKTYILKRGEMF